MATYKITGTHSTFIVTYARNRLKRVEIKYGNNEKTMWHNFIFSLPHREDELEEFGRKYKNVVIAAQTEKTKEVSQYKHYVSDWFLFYFNINDIEPKFTATDGKCIRDIMKHFEAVSNTPKDARAAWQALLKQWHTLPDFYRKKTDLAFINAKLNEIITQLKDERNTKAKANSDAEDLRR